MQKEPDISGEQTPPKTPVQILLPKFDPSTGEDLTSSPYRQWQIFESKMRNAYDGDGVQTPEYLRKLAQVNPRPVWSIGQRGGVLNQNGQEIIERKDYDFEIHKLLAAEYAGMQFEEDLEGIELSTSHDNPNFDMQAFKVRHERFGHLLDANQVAKLAIRSYFQVTEGIVGPDQRLSAKYNLALLAIQSAKLSKQELYRDREASTVAAELDVLNKTMIGDGKILSGIQDADNRRSAEFEVKQAVDLYVASNLPNQSA